jgi:phosphoglycolate phosphatase
LQQPEAILFDFDYTLADSSTGIISCSNHALQQIGWPEVSSEQVCSCIGLSLDEMFLRFTGCSDPDQSARFRELFTTMADRIMLDSTRLYDGVPALLAELGERGIRLGIVTTKYTYRIEEVLQREGLLECFQTIVGRDQVSAPKPDPQGLCKAMSAVATSSERALFVGDSAADAGAAAAAGVRFVAVATGTTPPDELNSHPVAAVLPTVRHLTAWLDGEVS